MLYDFFNAVHRILVRIRFARCRKNPHRLLCLNPRTGCRRVELQGQVRIAIRTGINRKPRRLTSDDPPDRCPAAVRRVSSSTHDFYSQILAQGSGVLLDSRQTHVFGAILDSRNCRLLSSQSPCDENAIISTGARVNERS